MKYSATLDYPITNEPMGRPYEGGLLNNKITDLKDKVAVTVR